jgi:hypothetical protein
MGGISSMRRYLVTLETSEDFTNYVLSVQQANYHYAVPIWKSIVYGKAEFTKVYTAVLYTDVDEPEDFPPHWQSDVPPEFEDAMTVLLVAVFRALGDIDASATGDPAIY